jgi:hypothetical protein
MALPVRKRREQDVAAWNPVAELKQVIRRLARWSARPGILAADLFRERKEHERIGILRRRTVPSGGVAHDCAESKRDVTPSSKCSTSEQSDMGSARAALLLGRVSRIILGSR